MSEQILGNLYDMNKAMILKEKPLKNKALDDAFDKVEGYIDKTKNNYYMLLCNELRDYTVFNLVTKTVPIINTYEITKNELKECCKNRGRIYSVTEDKQNGGIEIWIKTTEDDELHVYYFFPYDAAVIEV